MEVPEGYVVTKKGGRPSKKARHIAIVLALFWREQIHGEKRWQAMDWVMSRWTALGKGGRQKPIFADASEVRRAVRNARKVIPVGTALGTDHFVVGLHVSSTDVDLDSTPFGTPCWLWMEGMPEAVEGHKVDVGVLED